MAQMVMSLVLVPMELASSVCGFTSGDAAKDSLGGLEGSLVELGASSTDLARNKAVPLAGGTSDAMDNDATQGQGQAAAVASGCRARVSCAPAEAPAPSAVAVAHAKRAAPTRGKMKRLARERFVARVQRRAIED